MFESSKLVMMTNLTEVAVYPRPIERQRVVTCLKIFSAKTETALKIYGADDNVYVKGTVMILEKVSKWWTILNVKQKGFDVRNREPLQAIISQTDVARLQYITEFGKMCLNMAGKQGKRVQ